MSTWIDHLGKAWPVIASRRRLKFKIPCHAAVRAFVFHRDDYRCVRCHLQAASVPVDYDGRETLATSKRCSDGFPVLLVVDHMLTLKAGGLNVVENFQTLCETCNRRKQREDKAATAEYVRARLSGGHT